MSTPSRLDRQICFLLEIDQLKAVVRKTPLTTDSRRETSAEHSWHFAVLAMLLTEYAPFEKLDLLRVLKMVLVHDLVEIDAGDTYVYDAAANVGRLEREIRAADRIFGMLPPDQAAELRGLWDEFEARQTPEAKYAAALDRVQPVLLNYATQGKIWREHNISKAQVIERTQAIADGTPKLWDYVRQLIDTAADKGWLTK
jgi:putative hydrolase of HD superfamily